MWIIISWILWLFRWLFARTHVRCIHSPVFNKAIHYFTNDEVTTYFEDRDHCVTMSKRQHYSPVLVSKHTPILLSAHIQGIQGPEYAEGVLFDTICTILKGRALHHKKTEEVFQKEVLNDNELCVLSDISRRYIASCELEIMSEDEEG